MKIKCLIVDDEPIAIRILENYCQAVPNLSLIGTCEHAFAAMEILQKESVDLMFLDINMPKLSGISLLKSLIQPPKVIFTTAYPKYAVEGFDLEAVDYLLKPFSLERFTKAVNRVTQQLAHKSNRVATDFLMLKAEKRMYKVDFQDIQYISAYGDYIKIFTKDKMLLSKMRLSTMEEQLPKRYFQKIHRSHIIRLAAIEFIEGHQVKIGAEKLPIGANYRKELLSRY